jgi:BlaI family transcriptional regulator, penicillinase repressor
METKTTLGDLQLAIMRVLWDKREATAADVHAALERERGLAPTTIATMLMKMEKKGVVRHTVDGRRFIYEPSVSESQVRRSMVSELHRRLFAGDTTAFVSHLLSEHEIDPQELAELKKLLRDRTEGKPGSRKKEKA